MDDPKVLALLEEIRNNQLKQIEIAQSVRDESRGIMAQQRENVQRARTVLIGVIGVIAFLCLVLLGMAAKVIFR